MRLLQLDIAGFGGAPDGSFALAAPERVATQIVGPCGAGKTSIVETIALVAACAAGTGAPVDVAAAVRDGRQRAQAALTLELSDAEAEAARLGDRVTTVSVEIADGRRRAHAPPGVAKLLRGLTGGAPPIEVIPESRADKTIAPKLPSAEELRVRALDVGAQKYTWVPLALASFAAADGAALREYVTERGLATAGDVPGKLERVQAALSKLHPTLRIGRSFRRDQRLELGFEGGKSGVRTFGSLDRFERDALLFATLVARLPSEGAVLVVDAVDQHVPAERCAGFVEALAELARGHLVVTARVPCGSTSATTLVLPDSSKD